MYVGPESFVESEFVTRMRKKLSTTNEDGIVELNTKGKILFSSIGVAWGLSLAAALNTIAKSFR